MNNFILNYDPLTDSDIIDLIYKINKKDDIQFTTSGTTGEPKEVKHSYDFITKNIKLKQEYTNANWGLTYPSYKIAGSQVILQAYLNNSKIVNLFGKPLSQIPQLIETYNITHLSATPTFYRLILDGSKYFEKVTQITLGGEPVDKSIISKINKFFPNAKVKNIYASTEHGTLFTSTNDYFDYTEKLSKFVKIENNRLVINHSGQWEITDDLVEWIDDRKFKITGRESNIINIGGYKVNPIDVESKINSLDYVKSSQIITRPNSVLGTILVANIVLTENIDKVLIKKDFKTVLLPYEMPVKINIVESFNTTDTGKLIRL